MRHQLYYINNKQETEMARLVTIEQLFAHIFEMPSGTKTKFRQFFI